jgi:hypothetical protein
LEDVFLFLPETMDFDRSGVHFIDRESIVKF